MCRWMESDCRVRESELVASHRSLAKTFEAVVGCGTEGSGTLPRRGRLGLSGQTRFLRFSHFKLNNALTWAVTVTVWGENSSVGAGAASAFMAITRGTIPMGRTFS